MKFYFKNFGCKTNWFDLVALKERLKSFVDVSEVDFDESDVVVLNSCSVTRDAERELLKFLRRAKRMGKKVVVTGCLANHPDAQKKLEGADAVLGAGEYLQENIKAMLEAISEGERFFVSKDRVEASESLDDDLDWFLRSPNFARHRVYIKVQEGCSRFCSFCSIPLTRGKPKSVLLEKIVYAVKKVRDKGFHEVVLVGTHLALWGEEFGLKFSDLVMELAKLEEIKIRFSSLSPGELDEKFFEALEMGRDVFQPHFHLSVQSGSNRVLKSMRRWHTFEDFLEDSEKLLRIFPQACISTDVIVGFPTETDKDFEESLENIKRSPVGHIHVFPFSPRPKTLGALLKPLPPHVLKEREKRMLEVAKSKKREFLRKFLGREVDVIVERVKDGRFEGTSSNYIFVKGLGYVREGDNVLVKITGVEGSFALGELVQKELSN